MKCKSIFEYASMRCSIFVTTKIQRFIRVFLLNAFDSCDSCSSYDTTCIISLTLKVYQIRKKNICVVIFYVGYCAMFMWKYILNVRIAWPQKNCFEIFFLFEISFYLEFFSIGFFFHFIFLFIARSFLRTIEIRNAVSKNST